MIDAAVNAGANQVYGPSLSHGDQDELYRQALKAAVADARANAQALAVGLEPLARPHHAIVEGGGAPQPHAVRRRRQGDGRELDPDRARDAADHRERDGHLLCLPDVHSQPDAPALACGLAAAALVAVAVLLLRDTPPTLERPRAVLSRAVFRA